MLINKNNFSVFNVLVNEFNFNFNVQRTPISNRLAARWRRLDLFQQVGEASYIVTAIKYIWYY